MAVAADIIERVPIPKRFPIAHVGATVFLCILFCAQLAIGTNFVFAALVAIYGALAWTTVSVLGGPLSLGGFVISVCATIHVMFGQVVKTLLFEPPDRDLLAPIPTLAACVVGMAGFLLAALTLKVLRYENWKSILPTQVDATRLRIIGTLVFVIATGAILFLMLTSGGRFQTGGVFGILRTVSNSSLVGISLMVAASIVEHKRIFNAYIIIALCVEFTYATYNASRQNFIGPILIMGMIAVLFRHKFRLGEIVFFILGLWFYQTTFSPFALYARNEIRADRFDERFPKSFGLLGTFVTDKSLFTSKDSREQARLPYTQRRVYYYKSIPKNRTLDRLTLLPIIDAIIAENLTKEPLGAETTIWGLRLAVPSILLPDKPVISSTNFLAHKGRGLVNNDDHGTQISMGFTADALISYGWIGVFFTSAILAFVMISVYRTIFGHSLLFNAAAIGVMFQVTMIFTEGSIATVISNIVSFSPLVCGVYLALLWLANSMMRSRSPELTLVKPALPA